MKYSKGHIRADRFGLPANDAAAKWLCSPEGKKAEKRLKKEARKKSKANHSRG